MKRLIFSLFLVLFALVPITVMAQVTSAPVLIDLANGARWVDQINQHFKWHSVPGAERYEFQRDRDPNFPLAICSSVLWSGADTALGIGAGDPFSGGEHYWRVRGINNATGPGPWSEVRNYFLVPFNPAINAPSGEGVPRSTVIRWDFVNAATAYRLRVSVNFDFSAPVVDVIIPETKTTYNLTCKNFGTYEERSYPVSGLDTNTTYFASVGVLYEGGSVYGGLLYFTVGHVVPTASLISPPNGWAGTSMPRLVWSKSTAFATFQLATDQNFTNFIVNQPNTVATSVQYSNLGLGTYYWRVRPNGGEWTGAWSFTIVPATPIPDIPVLSSPANGSSSTASPLLVWNPAANATSYNLQVATDVNFSSLVVNQVGLTGTNYQTNLSPNTYYWRVSATNASGTSAFSSVSAFTISQPVIPTANLVSPINGYSSTQSPLLTWSRQNANQVNLEVATDLEFTNIVLILAGPINTSYQTNLSPGVYYWKVQPVLLSDPVTIGEWTGVWSFTITPPLPIPDIPTLSSPANGFSSTSSPLLVWNSSANAATYNVQVVSDQNFTMLVVNQTGLASLNYQTNLSPGVYYWWVSGTNATGTGLRSEVRGFTVTAPLPIPDIPVLSGPANGSSSTASPLLVWNPAANATSYNLQVATDQNFTTLVVNQTGLASLNYQTNLPVGTYYWRVRGTNSAGTGPWSLVWKFVVVAPDPPTLIVPVNNFSSYLSPLFRWNPAIAAMSYTLQVSKDSDFVNLTMNLNIPSVTSYQSSQLSSGTYFWRMNSISAAGTGSWSEVRSFTIAVVVVPPPAPVARPATGITLSGFIANWDPVNGAMSYQLDIARDSLFGNVVEMYFNLSATLSYKIVVGLPGGTKYFYRVRAANNIGISPNSNVIAVKTLMMSPAAPSLVLPSDGAVNVNLLSPLSWNKPTGEVNSYRLQVSTDFNFSLVVFDDSTLTTTSRQISNLTYNTKYYWRVRAKNAGGVSPYSQTWSFTTRQALTVANPFSIPLLTNAFPVFKRSLSNPPLFAGNIGTLVFTASSSNPVICTVSILEPDTLMVTGLWSGEVTVIVVAVDMDGTTASYAVPVQLTTAVEDEENMPQEFSLSQNYPNPFNPTTSIKYTVASSKYITLTVYDVLGREVAMLVRGEKPAGTYEVEFNASNLPSGMYLYRLQAGNFAIAKRMLLLK